MKQEYFDLGDSVALVEMDTITTIPISTVTTQTARLVPANMPVDMTSRLFASLRAHRIDGRIRLTKVASPDHAIAILDRDEDIAFRRRSLLVVQHQSAFKPLRKADACYVATCGDRVAYTDLRTAFVVAKEAPSLGQWYDITNYEQDGVTHCEEWAFGSMVLTVAKLDAQIYQTPPKRSWDKTMEWAPECSVVFTYECWKNLLTMIGTAKDDIVSIGADGKTLIAATDGWGWTLTLPCVAGYGGGRWAGQGFVGRCVGHLRCIDAHPDSLVELGIRGGKWQIRVKDSPNYLVMAAGAK